MRGEVSEELNARIVLALRGPGGTVSRVADIDTGFSEYLMVPRSMLAAINVVPSGGERAMLGHGEMVEFDTCEIEVQWSGIWRSIVAYMGDIDVLIRMKLLKGDDLHIRVVPGGEVLIAPA